MVLKRQTSIRTERMIDRQRQTDKQTSIQTERMIDGQRQTDKQTNGQTDRQKHRQTDEGTERQTNSWTDNRSVRWDRYRERENKPLDRPVNTKWGSITIPLISCLNGLALSFFANKNKNCQLSYSWFQTSQTGGQWYSDTSPFSIPWTGG